MKKQQKKQPGQKTKAPMRRSNNRTLENIMRQKVGNEDWGTARKRLIAEKMKNKADNIAEYGEKFRQDHRRRVMATRKSKFPNKKCKNCPG